MDGPAQRSKPLRFRVVGSEDGMMLCKLVSRRLTGVDTERAQEIIRAGGVYMGTVRVRVPTVRVATGERITVYAGAADVAPLPFESLKIVHRDRDCIVVDKPAGVPVIATRESARGTLADALMRKLEDEGYTRPYVGVVHRLDRGASGLVLFTIRDVANKSLHRQFLDHEIERSYLLLVAGETPPTMDCDLPLLEGRNEAATVRVARHGEARARPATTHFERIALLDGPRSLLRARLVTGRTHQIRVHAAELGHPIVGDRRYGTVTADEQPDRLYLHADTLVFTHPTTDEAVRVESDRPTWARASG